MTVVAVAVAACKPAPPSLQNTYPSSSDLAQALIRSLERNDRSRLEQMALDEREFRDHVWPQLPAARPERNLPFSYVWGDLRQKSASALSETLAAHRGKRYELLGVDFKSETSHGTYRVYRDSTLRVRDSGGKELSLEVFGSMIEIDGAWKIFSYVVD